MTDISTDLIQGNCIDVMGSMEPESVHAIVCDPPYFFSGDNVVKTSELLKKGEQDSTGFMGKEWDGGKVEVVEKDSVPEELL